MSDITSEYLCIIASYFIHLCTAHTTQYIRGYVEPARGLLCVLVYSLLVYLFYTLWQHSVQCARYLPIDTVYTILCDSNYIVSCIVCRVAVFWQCATTKLSAFATFIYTFKFESYCCFAVCESYTYTLQPK